MYPSRYRRFLLACMLLLVASPSLAISVTVFPKGGKIQDCTLFRSKVTISALTDGKFQEIDFGGVPISKEANAGNNFCVDFTFDEVVIDSEGKEREVIDAIQSVERIRSPGEISTLYLEALIFNAVTNQFELVSMFGTIAERLGFGTEVRVPDLFGDTNGDGDIGAGDVLYSLVDLTKYLDTIPTFSLGDTFDIVDGLAPELPGMMFSTVPFTFDPSSGFAGASFTGPGRVDAEHRLTAIIPEPGALALTLLGLSIAISRTSWASRRRNKPKEALN